MADPIFKELAYAALAQTARNPTQDFLRATPRNPVLGYLADLTASSYAPQRTQQMQGIAQFLGVPAVSQTLDRLSYGEPLTTGAGGLGGTTRLRPEAIEAAMTVAPMVGPAARMTKGLPVGMSIKDVSKAFPQEEALKLAQRRAALPVEQGGLGLGQNNTAAERAAAMGFDAPVYHATDVDFESIKPSVRGKMGPGVYVSPSSKYAEKYAGEEARVLPLLARGNLADDDAAIQIADKTRQELLSKNPNFSVQEWKQKTAQELSAAGYDGREIPGLESVIFNPDNIRSRFAAFDPFRKTAATAAAMGVAAPNLMAQERPSISEAEQRARIMLDIGQDPYTIYQQTGVWLGGNE